MSTVHKFQFITERIDIQLVLSFVQREQRLIIIQHPSCTILPVSNLKNLKLTVIDKF